MTGDEAVWLVEERYRPLLEAHAAELERMHPQWKSIVGGGSRRSEDVLWPTHDLWLRACPRDSPNDSEDTLFLWFTIGMRRGDVLRLEVDVCAEDGWHVDDFSGVRSSDDWPELTDKLLTEVDAALPRLFESLSRAMTQLDRDRGRRVQ